MIGATYEINGEKCLVVAIDDGFCIVVPLDPIRASTFDEEVVYARLPLAIVEPLVAASAVREARLLSRDSSRRLVHPEVA